MDCPWCWQELITFDSFLAKLWYSAGCCYCTQTLKEIADALSAEKSPTISAVQKNAVKLPHHRGVGRQGWCGVDYRNKRTYQRGHGDKIRCIGLGCWLPFIAFFLLEPRYLNWPMLKPEWKFWRIWKNKCLIAIPVNKLWLNQLMRTLAVDSKKPKGFSKILGRYLGHSSTALQHLKKRWNSSLTSINHTLTFMLKDVHLNGGDVSQVNTVLLLN